MPHPCAPIEMQIPSVENVQQTTLSGNHIVQDNQDEYQSSSSDEENSAGPNDDTMQTADNAEGVPMLAVEPEESSIQEPAIGLPVSTSGLLKREIGNSPLDNLAAERLDQTLDSTSVKSNEECESQKPKSLSISRKRERSVEVDIFEAEATADEGDKQNEEHDRKSK